MDEHMDGWVNEYMVGFLKLEMSENSLDYRPQSLDAP